MRGLSWNDAVKRAKKGSGVEITGQGLCPRHGIFPGAKKAFHLVNGRTGACFGMRLFFEFVLHPDGKADIIDALYNNAGCGE